MNGIVPGSTAGPTGTRRCRRYWAAHARCAPANPRCRTVAAATAAAATVAAETATDGAHTRRALRTNDAGARSSRRRARPACRDSSAARAQKIRCATTGDARRAPTGTRESGETVFC